jgi:hypothetical protein
LLAQLSNVPVLTCPFLLLAVVSFSYSTEFRFTTVGSNWPDYDAIEKENAAAAAEAKTKRWKAPRIRPLQRVRNLINGRRP